MENLQDNTGMAGVAGVACVGDDSAFGGNLSAEEFLLNTVGVSIRNIGQDDDRIDLRTEARIARLFDRYICGEASTGLILWNADGTINSYDGRVYVRNDADSLKRTIKVIMERCGVGSIYVTNSINKIYKQCMHNVSYGNREFKPNRRYAVFTNCVLDFKTGEMLEFSPKYITDIVFDFDYNSTAKSPLWDKFIVQTISSEEMRTAFKMFCGAFFADRREIKLELACYLIGMGRNGKSVAVSAIASTLGEKMCSFFSPQQLFTEHTCMYNRANADGKLANFSEDVKATDYSGGDFKQFVSGKPFEARRIYGQPYTMRSVPYMVMCVNAMPPTTDDSEGHYRRILPILCPNRVSEKDVDPMLEDKLRAVECRQAIFNWMYEGYKMFIAAGGKITKGNNIKDVQDELKADSNSGRRWIRDMGYVPVNPQDATEENWVSFKKLMEDYSKYCNEMAEPVKSQKGIGMIMKELGFESQRRSSQLCYCLKQELETIPDENLPF